MTCDVALVLGDDTLHAEAGYTAMTRARPATTSMPLLLRGPTTRSPVFGGRWRRARRRRWPMRSPDGPCERHPSP